MTDAELAPDDARAKIVGRLLVLAAALMWSSGGFFAKAPIFEGWPGGVLAFWRVLFACVVLWPMVRRPRWSWRLVPMVLTFAAMNFTYLTAMEKTEAGNAIWLQNTAPLWVFLVGVFVFRERVTTADWLVLAFGSGGVGFILTCEFTQGESFVGVIYGLLAGVTYAGTILSLRLLRDHDAAWLVALNHLTTAIILAPYVVYQGVWPSGWQWLFLAGFGMFQMGFPYLMFARGLRSISGHEASGIGLVEPVLVPVWVFVAWHNAPLYQMPQWWTLVGGGLILAGLLIRYCRRSR